MKEIGWFVGSTKSSQRKYAASKLISRLTGSARLLAMSWSQREFEGERGVALLLQRLSASPLVRRSLPTAAAIMSEYFGFKRRPQEHIGAFLVRETLGFEEFSEALLHLKAEHDGLDPASRNFGLPDISPDKAGISIGDIVVAGVIGLVGMTIQVMTTNRMMLTMFQIAMGMSLSLNSLTMAQSVQQILDCVLLLVVHHLGRQHFVQFLSTLN